MSRASRLLSGEPHPLQIKSIEELRQRKEAIIDDMYLKDGERKMFLMPAFDLRNTPDSNYGQGSVTMHFAERRGDNVISVEFFTGWNVSGVPTLMDGRDIGFMCAGLYYHTHRKKDVSYPEYASKNKKCGFTQKQCYGEAGSALYGDDIGEIMIHTGSEGVWNEINQAFKERYGH